VDSLVANKSRTCATRDTTRSIDRSSDSSCPALAVGGSSARPTPPGSDPYQFRWRRRQPQRRRCRPWRTGRL